MKPVHITINGLPYTVDSDQTILEAATKNNVFIPRLCFLKDVHEEANCRVCSVKIEGQKNLKPACKTLVTEGMNILTDDQDVYDTVSMNLELLTHRHHFECFKCSREDNCEFLDLLRKYSIDNEFSQLYGMFDEDNYYYQDDNGVMIIDSSKCILCGRCVSVCEKQSGLSVLNFNNRGNKTYVGPALFHSLDDAGCIYCGKCIGACPTGALREKDDIKAVERVLRDPKKKVVVQVAPAVRAALGEAFGYPIGTDVEGKMFHALKELGVDEIMDTNFTADLTILEEGTEFIHRLEHDGPFPMFTSCSPGWINLVELYYPEFIPNLSSCKSPQQMAGALIKTYYADKMGFDPKDIVSISIMPCIAKKAEARREGMGRDGNLDVDYVLTTREFARLIKRRGIDFRNLEDSKPFGMLATYTGAGAIFGATGGVMEAALRTVSEILENKETPIDFLEMRGTQDVKEATYTLQGKEINVAVVHGGAASKAFLEHLKTTDKQYHFVEFMGCTGGCINGGGQPVVTAKDQEKYDVRSLRASVLYKIDEKQHLRKSHQNPFVLELYQNFLGEPHSKKSHELLHTTYKKRSPYAQIE
ncbi:NADH-dependent [FeFe] hydrogenase, group A6 [Acholeplasma vituli]|uniref:NADH-dependent [FeFe] hydrogenase, group A6 n=1 Tax=Paracholeplasma vituli TaxID=69473 RepID=A0ABT2PUQ4_9MOLU|nr:NADH-dependent [FeFe] hydrogenase, group A6 [Paracholeplasma vituli]MCU0104680.1 NADH-dependent [FeFe] hydrogenase, group A6 [Paracholeplasma vituli]